MPSDWIHHFPSVSETFSRRHVFSLCFSSQCCSGGKSIPCDPVCSQPFRPTQPIDFHFTSCEGRDGFQESHHEKWMLVLHHPSAGNCCISELSEVEWLQHSRLLGFPWIYKVASERIAAYISFAFHNSWKQKDLKKEISSSVAKM